MATPAPEMTTDRLRVGITCYPSVGGSGVLATAKLRCAGAFVARWRRIVLVSRGSWSLSWQK